MNPRHANPKNPARTARAPYNFVSLPNEVMAAPPCGWRDADGSEIDLTRCHDRFVDGARSGWIDLTLTTSTQFFTRGPIVQAGDGSWPKTETRLRPEPFTTEDGRPMIPGSSLRGMVRTLVEILSFSRVAPVTTERPFFRTVSKGTLGTLYGKRMQAGTYGCGFARGRGDGWIIVPADLIRIDSQLVGIANYPNDDPDWKPPPGMHRRDCWVAPEAIDRMRIVSKAEFRFTTQTPECPLGWSPGVTVLTGGMQGKKREFVFLVRPKNDAEEIPIPATVIERFHDEDQMTQWQEGRFTRAADRPRDGALGENEPVFYLVDKDDEDLVVFFGRAGMFRLPYDLGPAQLIPCNDGAPDRDLAEAIFGTLGANGAAAVKGRVRFEDAIHDLTAAKPTENWSEPHVVKATLLSPHVQSFQHYLVQPRPDHVKTVLTYVDDHRDRTATRGHKLYWHRERPQSLARHTDGELKPTESLMKPVKKGTSFRGRIRFENLTDIELGALLTAVDLPGGHEHKLGMGKALGLGSVRCEAELHLTRPDAWYAEWQEGLDGSSDTDADLAEGFKSAFCCAVLAHAVTSGEPVLVDPPTQLTDVARLAELHTMLDRRCPPWAKTEPMDLKGEPSFKTRPVLPTPHGVRGQELPVVRPQPRPQEPPAAPGGAGQPAATTESPGENPEGAGPREGDLVRAKPNFRQPAGDWVVKLPDHGGMEARLRGAPGDLAPNVVIDGQSVLKAGKSPILIYRPPS